MTNHKERLKQLLKQPRWKILLFMLALNALLFWQAAIDYYFYLNFNFLFARRAFFKRTRQRAHWVGTQVAKPHRLAFTALAAVLLVGVLKAPDTQTVLYWCIGWGSVFSFFVVYRSAALILQHIVPQQRFNQEH
jgi:hypothetical protein